MFGIYWDDFLQSAGGIVFVALLGLMVGSFLNVLIYRLPVMMTREEQQYAWEVIHGEGEKNPAVPPEKFNIFTPRSRCPDCGAAIHFWQNIPVVSFVIQRGRCRGCQRPISKRYIAVEILSALLSVLVVLRYPEPWALSFSLLLTWTLLALFFIDAEQQLLPDVLTLPLMWLGILAALLGLFVPLSASVIGAMVGYLILWGIYWLFKLCTGKEGLGYGDFKLLAALCAWQGAGMLPVILFVAAGVGLIVALINKIGRGVPMAFGPYLILAGWLTFMYGGNIANIFGFSSTGF